MANFDKVILPGGEGKIALKIETKNYKGSITKSAKVKTNDPANNEVKITIKAEVIQIIQVMPTSLNFVGIAGQEIKKTIMISTDEKKPLELEEISFNLPQKLTYRIEEVKKGKQFRISFTNIPGVAEVYQGELKFKTNFPEKQELTIPIRGRLRRAPAKNTKGRVKDLSSGK